MARITEADPDQQQVHQQRQKGEKDPDRIDEKQQGREQGRTCDQRHPERHDAERFARELAALTQIEELTDSDSQQDQAARHLEIGNGDAQRAEDYFAEENKTDRNSQARDEAQNTFYSPAV